MDRQTRKEASIPTTMSLSLPDALATITAQHPEGILPEEAAQQLRDQGLYEYKGSNGIQGFIRSVYSFAKQDVPRRGAKARFIVLNGLIYGIERGRAKRPAIETPAPPVSRERSPIQSGPDQLTLAEQLVAGPAQEMLRNGAQRPQSDLVTSAPHGLILPCELTGPERPSIPWQARLVWIGARMGNSIWVPPGDRAPIQRVLGQEMPPLLDKLPFRYDQKTTRSFEQIDVLWINNRYVERAFEVEHTTAIYSGLARMADLLALQPNLDIKLHIVAPEERRDEVMTQICRPIFDLARLREKCTYLSYANVAEIAAFPHLHRVSTLIVDDYGERAQEEA